MGKVKSIVQVCEGPEVRSGDHTVNSDWGAALTLSPSFTIELRVGSGHKLKPSHLVYLL